MKKPNTPANLRMSKGGDRDRNVSKRKSVFSPKSPMTLKGESLMDRDRDGGSTERGGGMAEDEDSLFPSRKSFAFFFFFLFFVFCFFFLSISYVLLFSFSF